MKWYQYYEKSSGKQPDIEFEFKAKIKKKPLTNYWTGGIIAQRN